MHLHVLVQSFLYLASAMNTTCPRQELLLQTGSQIEMTYGQTEPMPTYRSITKK